MAAIKNYMLDAHEVANSMAKREDIGLQVEDWGAFEGALTETLIDQGWKAPSQIKQETK